MIDENPLICPKAVCIFCIHSFSENTDREKIDEEYPHSLFCKKNKFNRTIDPILGQPSFYQTDREGKFNDFCKEEYGLCLVFNNDGTCHHFEKEEIRLEEIDIEELKVDRNK